MDHSYCAYLIAPDCQNWWMFLAALIHSSQHQENRHWPNQWFDVSSFMILPDVLGAFLDCLQSSTCLNGMTHRCPPPPLLQNCVVYNMLLKWWLAFVFGSVSKWSANNLLLGPKVALPSNFSCSFYLSLVPKMAKKFSRRKLLHTWWTWQVQHKKFQTSCTKHIYTVHCTLRENVFDCDLNARW
jgi:hypothetical protein